MYGRPPFDPSRPDTEDENHRLFLQAVWTASGGIINGKLPAKIILELNDKTWQASTKVLYSEFHVHTGDLDSIGAGVSLCQKGEIYYSGSLKWEAS